MTDEQRAYWQHYIWRRTTYNIESGCWDWSRCKSRGYGACKVLIAGQRYKLAHRVSYVAFNGEVAPELEVRHACHRPICCNPDHLSLGTHKQNMEDMVRANRSGGASLPGMENGFSKLTDEEVYEIRNLAGHLTNKQIARRFGVSGTWIGKILSQDAWKHLTP